MHRHYWLCTKKMNLYKLLLVKCATSFKTKHKDNFFDFNVLMSTKLIYILNHPLVRTVKTGVLMFVFNPLETKLKLNI